MSLPLADAPPSQAADPLRDHLVSHWAPLPGWTPERALLACYATVEDQPAVHALVDAYQRPLRDLPQLDLIDRRWLHVTVQGVGFLDVLAPGSLAQLVTALRPRLAVLPAPEVEAGPAEISTDAVFVPLRPAAGLALIRQAVRDAAHAALGLPEPYALPGQEGEYDPHLSIAYANAPVPVARVGDRLAAVQPPPVTVTLRGMTVLSLRRTGRTWEWTDAVHLPLGRAVGAVPAMARPLIG
jgi:hypothetical protein